MIFIRLSGGLGNQLYQLAAASLLAQELKCPAMPFADALQSYTVPRDPDSFKLLQWNDWLKEPSPVDHRFGHWLSVDCRVGRFMPILGISDRNFFSHTRRPSGLPRFLDGYFQHGWNDHSFTKALSGICFRPAESMNLQVLDSNEVGIHIRGGDFLQLPRFQVVHAPFYVEAAKQALAEGFSRFAVITDDSQYATEVCKSIQQALPAVNLRILDRSTTALDDFHILRAAPARIIGNSTFAWWASALGSADSPTWSPPLFTTDDRRDFFLSNERVIDNDIQ